MLKTAILDSNTNRKQTIEDWLRKDRRVEQTEGFTSLEQCLAAVPLRQGEEDLLFVCGSMFGKDGLQRFLDSLSEEAPWLQVVCYFEQGTRIESGYLALCPQVLGVLGLPCTEKDISDCVEQALCRKNPHRLVRLVRRGSEIFLRADSIVMVESQKHTAVITTVRDQMTVRAKLSEILAQFPDYFWQCHKSYAFNSRFIERYQAGDVLLTTGAVIPVSRKYKNGIRKAVAGMLAQEERSIAEEMKSELV